jgi:hypothetical protein
MSARTLFRFEPWPVLAMKLQRLADSLARVGAARSAECPDAAALRDLGIHASEWQSVQAEAAGRAPPTRRRIVR